MDESSKKLLKLIGLGVAAFALLLALMAGVYFALFESEENKIRRMLGEVAEAAGERSAGGVTRFMTGDFKIGFRRYRVGKDEVHKQLIRLFLVEFKHGFRLELRPEEVPVEVAEDQQTAVARFTVYAKGRKTKDGPWLELGSPEASGKIMFETTVTKTVDGEWRIKGMKLHYREAAKKAAALSGKTG